MKFQQGQIIKFKPENDPTRLVDGKIITTAHVGGKLFYWIETAGAIIPDPAPYPEDKVIEWNQSYAGKCTCGAKKLGHPAHSSWCDSLVTTKDNYLSYPWFG